MERPIAPNPDGSPTQPMKANPELEPKFLQPGNRATGQRLSLRCASTAPNVIALSPGPSMALPASAG